MKNKQTLEMMIPIVNLPHMPKSSQTHINPKIFFDFPHAKKKKPKQFVFPLKLL
jgi:hypothetical protein